MLTMVLSLRDIISRRWLVCFVARCDVASNILEVMVGLLFSMQ